LQSIKEPIKREDLNNENIEFELMKEYRNQCFLQNKSKQWDTKLEQQLISNNNIKFDNSIKYKQVNFEKKSILIQNNNLIQLNNDIKNKKNNNSKEVLDFRSDRNTMYNSPKKITKNKTINNSTNSNSLNNSFNNNDINMFFPKGIIKITFIRNISWSIE
jgi:hypothetical protein